MIAPDVINAAFECGGGILMGLNIRRILKDRIVRGVAWPVIAFFAVWGGWNLFYYPHLGQWASFAAGVALVVTNTIYAGLLVHYTIKEHRRVQGQGGYPYDFS